MSNEQETRITEEQLNYFEEWTHTRRTEHLEDSYYSDTQFVIAELRGAWERIKELERAAEIGYGWICNFPTPSPNGDSLVTEQQKFAAGKTVGDILYSKSRPQKIGTFMGMDVLVDESIPPGTVRLQEGQSVKGVLKVEPTAGEPTE